MTKKLYFAEVYDPEGKEKIIAMESLSLIGDILKKTDLDIILSELGDKYILPKLIRSGLD